VKVQHLRVIEIFSTVVLSACAPLQQAPLVYSSKVTVGVDVSVSVAESQGGAINIGVKSVDSAYVPVAISKELDKKDSSTGKTVDIQLVEARYGSGSGPDSSDEVTRAERNRKIDDYLAKKKAADEAVKASADAEEALSDLNKTIAAIDSQRIALTAEARLVPPVPADGTEPAASDVLEKRAAAIADLSKERSLAITALTRSINGAYNTQEVDASLLRVLTENRQLAQSYVQSRLPELKAIRQAKADEAARAKDEAIRVAGLAQTSKTDAMSVYGRFDSNGRGDAKAGTGQVLVGKVFSTGLASQNLTEAVKIEASSRCLAAGFDVVKSLQQADQRGFLDNLAKWCAGSAQVRTDN
jgi:hypothetical protein